MYQNEGHERLRGGANDGQRYLDNNPTGRKKSRLQLEGLQPGHRKCKWTPEVSRVVICLLYAFLAESVRGGLNCGNYGIVD
jgi:hypothetical protein